MKKWIEYLNRHFFKENIQVAKRHMKRCSTLLIIGKMQIKITVRYYFIPISMSVIKKQRCKKYWQGWKVTLKNCIN